MVIKVKALTTITKDYQKVREQLGGIADNFALMHAGREMIHAPKKSNIICNLGIYDGCTLHLTYEFLVHVKVEGKELPQSYTVGVKATDDLDTFSLRVATLLEVDPASVTFHYDGRLLVKDDIANFSDTLVIEVIFHAIRIHVLTTCGFRYTVNLSRTQTIRDIFQEIYKQIDYDYKGSSVQFRDRKLPRHICLSDTPLDDLNTVYLVTPSDVVMKDKSLLPRDLFTNDKNDTDKIFPFPQQWLPKEVIIIYALEAYCRDLPLRAEVLDYIPAYIKKSVLYMYHPLRYKKKCSHRHVIEISDIFKRAGCRQWVDDDQQEYHSYARIKAVPNNFEPFMPEYLVRDHLVSSPWTHKRLNEVLHGYAPEFLWFLAIYPGDDYIIGAGYMKIRVPPLELRVTGMRPVRLYHYARFMCVPHALLAGIIYCSNNCNAGCRELYTPIKHALICSVEELSTAGWKTQHSKIQTLMEQHLPWIGRPTIYCCRTSNKRKRHLEIEDVCQMRMEYPLLLWLTVPTGQKHAVCVVDDIILDPAVKYPLKLCVNSFHWISEVGMCTIEVGMHFKNCAHRTKQLELRRLVMH